MSPSQKIQQSSPPDVSPSHTWRRLSSISSRFGRKSIDVRDPNFDLEDISETTTPNPSSTVELTQRVSSQPPAPSPIDTNDHDVQASGLILGAVDRGRTGSGSSRNILGLKSQDDKTNTNPSTSTSTNPNPNPILQSKPIGSSVSGRQRRPPSPFFRARRSREQARARDTSPEVGALEKDAGAESDGESVGGARRFRPQASAYEDADESGTEAETEPESDESDDNASLGDDEDITFDAETEKNTEANAVFYEGDATSGVEPVVMDEAEGGGSFDTFGEEIEQDPLGEGPNVIVPPQPLFPTPTQPRRRKSMKSVSGLVTSRPTFARDRCTITLTHGDPDGALEISGKRLRRYVVLSDLSDESRYAVEWAIGTVARDGDEVFVISVKEDEAKGTCRPPLFLTT